jgi:beta-glucosidase
VNPDEVVAAGAAIQAGVLSVMCAYNRVNDVYACENTDTLSHLRKDLGFPGWVMSDWLATKSTVDSFSAGLDQEMPLGLHYHSEIILAELLAGNVKLEQIDEAVYRILYAMYSIGLFDSDSSGDPLADVTSTEHNQLTRQLAAESTVLLKNENHLLPLTMATFYSENKRYKDGSVPAECIAVFGDEYTVSGGGSGHVAAGYIVTPTQGITAAVENMLKDSSGSSGDMIIDVFYSSGANTTEVVALAQRCSVAVVVVGVSSVEGEDRESLSLGAQQDELVSTVTAANTRTVVDVRTPGAVLLPWVDQV